MLFTIVCVFLINGLTALKFEDCGKKYFHFKFLISRDLRFSIEKSTRLASVSPDYSEYLFRKMLSISLERIAF